MTGERSKWVQNNGKDTQTKSDSVSCCYVGPLHVQLHLLSTINLLSSAGWRTVLREHTGTFFSIIIFPAVITGSTSLLPTNLHGQRSPHVIPVQLLFLRAPLPHTSPTLRGRSPHITLQFTQNHKIAEIKYQLCGETGPNVRLLSAHKLIKAMNCIYLFVLLIIAVKWKGQTQLSISDSLMCFSVIFLICSNHILTSFMT